MNTIIGKVNDHTDSKANLSGADFTGEVSFNRVSSSVIPSESKQYDLGTINNIYRTAFVETLNVDDNLVIQTSNSDVIFNHKSSSGTLSEGIRIIDGGVVKINNSYVLPSTDGTTGQVLATDGNGNVIFKTLENESSDFAQYIIDYDFVTDGSTTSYTVNATSLNKVIFVEINGLIQKEGVDYTVTNKTITFNEAPLAGNTGTIKFWGNDISSVISTKNFVGDGSTVTFTTDTKLNKIVLVEINGLIQKQGENFNIDTVNNRVTFTDTIPSGVTGTIVYV